MVMQRPAKPCTPVRFRPQPPYTVSHSIKTRNIQSFAGFFWCHAFPCDTVKIRFLPNGQYLDVLKAGAPVIRHGQKKSKTSKSRVKPMNEYFFRIKLCVDGINGAVCANKKPAKSLNFAGFCMA